MQHALLEPMDLVTVTDANLGYAKHPVRITSIVEDVDGKLAVDAEDFPWSTATATLYPHQAGAGYAPKSTADPGNVNPPVIFEPNNRLSHMRSNGTQQGYQIWFALSGASADWGGCSVWLSPDGNTYQRIGVIFGAARMGTLTASLPSAADPDTTDTLSVDLTGSFGSLSSGSQADCDNYRTLCYVDGEYISYQSATLIAQYKYNLGSRMRRGVFGSAIASHASGSAFVRLDDAVFNWVYDPTLVGQLLYFKFTSFNKNGEMEQSLANVAAYQYVVAGGAGSNGKIIATTTSVSANVTGQTIVDAAVAVTGAQVGMHVSVSAVQPLGAGWNQFSWSAWVSAANQVTVRLTNPGAVTLNLPPQTFAVRVFQ